MPEEDLKGNRSSEFEEKLNKIGDIWYKVLDEFFAQANLRSGQILVLGCSTSEVLGKHIGKGSSTEVAEILLPPLLKCVRERGLYLAVQGCEHINRALVVEEECVERYGLEPVTVLPGLKAGGAMSVKAYQSFSSPVMVESIKGHAGIDIGDTFIGMHLRPVAVPIRLIVKEIGEAHLTMARTRPRLIGGPRAIYPE
ncbi:TIGR01440 family protein [Desulfitobacterium sp. AusDCA]